MHTGGESSRTAPPDNFITYSCFVTIARGPNLLLNLPLSPGMAADLSVFDNESLQLASSVQINIHQQKQISNNQG